MKTPFLIAKTPRAGRWNHRYLVPQAHLHTDQEHLMDWMAAANSPDSEDRLLGVKRTVLQQSGREGEEALVLVGIDLQKLDTEQRETLTGQLYEYLRQLGTWVEQFDWDRHGQDMVVHLAALDEWGQAFKDLPSVELTIKKTTPKRRLWGSVVLVSILFLGIGIYQFKAKQEQGSSDQPPPDATSETGGTASGDPGASGNTDQSSEPDLETLPKDKCEILVGIVGMVGKEECKIQKGTLDELNGCVNTLICQIKRNQSSKLQGSFFNLGGRCPGDTDSPSDTEVSEVSEVNDRYLKKVNEFNDRYLKLVGESGNTKVFAQFEKIKIKDECDITKNDCKPIDCIVEKDDTISNEDFPFLPIEIEINEDKVKLKNMIEFVQFFDHTREDETIKGCNTENITVCVTDIILPLREIINVLKTRADAGQKGVLTTWCQKAN